MVTTKVTAPPSINGIHIVLFSVQTSIPYIPLSLINSFFWLEKSGITNSCTDSVPSETILFMQTESPIFKEILSSEISETIHANSFPYLLLQTEITPV